MAQTVIQFTDSSGFGGAEEMLLRLLDGLDRRRWEPILMHHDGPGITPMLERARRLGVRLRAVPRLAGRRDLSRLPGLIREIRSEGPAIFHAHLCWTLRCSYGLMAAALARVPGIVATQQLFSEIRHPRGILRQRTIAAGVDRYIAVSRDLAMRLAATPFFPRRKIRMIPNAVRLEPFAPSRSDRRPMLTGADARPIVLTLARLDPQKGLSTLLEAARLVSEAQFVVAGEGPERPALEAQIHRLGLERRVSLLGHRDDVAELLADCDLFVLPSLYEGLPVSVLEAMASEKPVVATAIGGTDEAVVNGSTGLLVPPGDPAALAEAIRSVLGDPQLARRFGEAGRRRVFAEFSAERMVLRVSDLYEEILAA